MASSSSLTPQSTHSLHLQNGLKAATFPLFCFFFCSNTNYIPRRLLQDQSHYLLLKCHGEFAHLARGLAYEPWLQCTDLGSNQASPADDGSVAGYKLWKVPDAFRCLIWNRTTLRDLWFILPFCLPYARFAPMKGASDWTLVPVLFQQNVRKFFFKSRGY